MSNYDQYEIQRLKKELESSKKKMEKNDETISTQNQIIDQIKASLSKSIVERDDLKSKLMQVTTHRDEMEMHFEGIMRGYKQSIEKKQQELEDLQAKLTPMLDNDLTKLKIRNEMEQIYKIELQQRDDQVVQLQAKFQELRNRLEIEKQMSLLQREEFENDKQRLQIKFKEEVKNMNLRILELKDMDQINQKDRSQIKELLQEKLTITQALEEKDRSIKSLRQQVEFVQNEKSKWVEQLTAELETERQKKRMLISENERLKATEPQQPQQRFEYIKPDTNDKTIRELHTQVNEYQRLCEEERRSKHQMQEKLNQVINAIRREKEDYDKINENKIHDLQVQLKDENRQVSKLQAKVKDILQQLTSLNEECIELRERISQLTKERITYNERISQLTTQLPIQLPTQLPIQLPTQLPQRSTQPKEEPGQMDYEVNKLKTKYRRLKEKLKEANSKILSLLSKRLQKENPQNQDVGKISQYTDYYKLSRDTNYLNNPYENSQTSFPMDLISQKLRSEVLNQNYRI